MAAPMRAGGTFHGMLARETTTAISARLGVPEAAPDLATLERICAGLHRHVGYDTTPKQRWAFDGGHGDPPGLDPSEYWDTFLTHGASGTCFATALALDAYLNAVGFDTTISAWRMLGRPTPTGFGHATNTISIGADRYIVEASSSVPAPLLWPGDDGATGDAGGVATVTSCQGRTRMHLPRAAGAGAKAYELVDADVTRDTVAASYHDMVRLSPGPQRDLVWARTRSDGVTASIGEGTYLLRAGYQVLASTSIDAAAARAALSRGGHSAEWLDELDRIGVLER